jgi:hypothetical protein
MTENTTPTAGKFSDICDFIARAQVGDSYREEITRTITDWTVTAIQTDSSLSPRLIHLAGITTAHEGAPAYCYDSRRVTRRASVSGRTYSIIFSRGDLNQRLISTPAQRFSAKGLHRAHEACIGA